MSPEYGCLFGLAITQSTGRDYPDIGLSNLYHWIYLCPHIYLKYLQQYQPIRHLCDWRHMQEVWGYSTLSWRNSEMRFLLSSFLGCLSLLIQDLRKPSQEPSIYEADFSGAISPLPNRGWDKFQFTVPNQERGFHPIIFSSAHRILGESCLPIYSALSKWWVSIPSYPHIEADSWTHP